MNRPNFLSVTVSGDQGARGRLVSLDDISSVILTDNKEGDVVLLKLRSGERLTIQQGARPLWERLQALTTAQWCAALGVERLPDSFYGEGAADDTAGAGSQS